MIVHLFGELKDIVYIELVLNIRESSMQLKKQKKILLLYKKNKRKFNEHDKVISKHQVKPLT